MSEPFSSPQGRSFGYADQVTAVRQALSDPDRSGCMLIGAAGIGKTTVMNLALQHLESETVVHRFRGSEVLHDRELGILEILQSQAGVTRGIGVGAALSTVARMFKDSAQGTIPIVRVDNSNLVDSSSLSILCQLAEAGRIRLLVGAESVRPPVDLVAKLWLSGKIARVDLNGIDEAAIAAMIQLSDRSRKSAAELHWQTGDNPRLLNHVLYGDQKMRTKSRILWNIPDALASVLEMIAMAGALP